MKRKALINNLFFSFIGISILFLTNSIILLHETEKLWITMCSFTVTFISMVGFLYLLNVKIIWAIKKPVYDQKVKITTKKRLIFWYVFLILILLLGIWFIQMYRGFMNWENRLIPMVLGYEIPKPSPEEFFIHKTLYCIGVPFVITSIIYIIAFTSLFLKENFTIKKREINLQKEEETLNQIKKDQN